MSAEPAERLTTPGSEMAPEDAGDSSHLGRDPVAATGRVPVAAVDAWALTRALRSVIDPELGVNIVDLGLVYDARVVDGVAQILITTTTPACPLGPYLSDAIRWALLDLDGVPDVEIEVTYEPLWSPERMSEEAKMQLGWPG